MDVPNLLSPQKKPQSIIMLNHAVNHQSSAPYVFVSPKKIMCAYFLTILTSIIPFCTIAQPSNDNVCSALVVVVDAIPSLVSSMGATTQTGEDAIAPPFESSCAVEGFWCDGPNGQNAVIDNSIWFKFIAPASGTVDIILCGSNYDTQLALYEVGNCSDFSSFSLIWAKDDQAGCGPNGYSSSFVQGCLVPGATYYILVDGWQGSGNETTDFVSLEITSESAALPVSITDTTIIHPTCPGGTDGSIDITVDGTNPINYNWSNGDSTQDISNLSAGTYSVTITDYCMTTALKTYTIIDPVSAPPFNYTVPMITHPSNCDSLFPGQVLIEITEGTKPFSFQWSHGESTGFAGSLLDGIYYLSISDQCNNPIVDTFVIGVSAGPDRYVCNTTAQIGCHPDISGGRTDKISYNSDQEVTIAAASCSGGGNEAQNSYYRAFDLDTDFGLSGTVKIKGLEIFLKGTGGPAFLDDQPMEIAIHSSTSMDLSTATLTEVQRLSLNLPNLPVMTRFVAPVAGTFQSTDIVAVEVSIPGPSNAGHDFELGANNTATSQPSYISSTDCGLPTPTTFADLGFSMQSIMNLFIDQGSDQLSFSWTNPGGYLSNPNIANPTVSGPGSFVLSVYDSACDITLKDTVVVTSCGVTWTGAVSRNWNQGNNWSLNTVPTINDDVIIPNTTNDPVIGTGQTAQIKSLLIEPYGNLMIRDGGELIVGNRIFTVADNGILDVRQGGILQVP